MLSLIALVLRLATSRTDIDASTAEIVADLSGEVEGRRSSVGQEWGSVPRNTPRYR